MRASLEANVVQILNSKTFEAVTGKAPPETPVTAASYAKEGLPYFDIFDEKPSGIKGDFKLVKSVNTIDKSRPETRELDRSINEVDSTFSNPVVRLGADGTRMTFFDDLRKGGKGLNRGFRSVLDLEGEVKAAMRKDGRL